MRQRTTRSIQVAGVAALVIGAVAGFHHQAAAAEDAGIEAAGHQQFMDQCAICHGPDGRGNGPFVSLLNTEPPDLRTLASRNDGRFPFWRVYEMIDGRDMPAAHGTREMPIWGAHWKDAGPDAFSETYLRGRILEMIGYLYSIQD